MEESCVAGMLDDPDRAVEGGSEIVRVDQGEKLSPDAEFNGRQDGGLALRTNECLASPGKNNARQSVILERHLDAVEVRVGQVVECGDEPVCATVAILGRQASRVALRVVSRFLQRRHITVLLGRQGNLANVVGRED